MSFTKVLCFAPDPERGDRLAALLAEVGWQVVGTSDQAGVAEGVVAWLAGLRTAGDWGWWEVLDRAEQRPTLFVVGEVDEDVARHMVEAGAEGVVPERLLATVVPLLRRAIGRYRRARAGWRVEGGDGQLHGGVGGPFAAGGVAVQLQHLGVEAPVSEKEKLAAIGRLAAGVAHQINNPAFFVTANLQHLREYVTLAREVLAVQQREVLAEGSGDGASRVATYRLQAGFDTLDGEVDGLLNDAQSGMQRISGVVRGLGLLAETGAARPTAVDLNDVVDSVVAVLDNRIRLCGRLERRFTPLPEVLAPQSRLRQAVLNLLLNAVQAIEARPPDAADPGRIVVGTSLHDGCVAVHVEDNGAGISDAIRSELFEPFFSTRSGADGTGLGLTVARSVMRAMGGDVTVDSVPGVGARFSLWLPTDAATRAVPPAQAPGDLMVAQPTRRRILVVDDDPGVLRAMEWSLRQRYDVATASSAYETLERLRGGERFDLVLCDLMMPDMTGMELDVKLGREWPDVRRRTVYMTGGAFTAAAAEFMRNDEAPTFEKTLDVDALRAMVAERLETLEHEEIERGPRDPLDFSGPHRIPDGVGRRGGTHPRLSALKVRPRQKGRS